MTNDWIDDRLGPPTIQVVGVTVGRRSVINLTNAEATVDADKITITIPEVSDTVEGMLPEIGGGGYCVATANAGGDAVIWCKITQSHVDFSSGLEAGWLLLGTLELTSSPMVVPETWALSGYQGAHPFDVLVWTGASLTIGLGNVSEEYTITLSTCADGEVSLHAGACSVKLDADGFTMACALRLHGKTGAVNVQTLSADKTLTTDDPIFQKLNGGVADRNVMLTDVTARGLPFCILNSGATNNLLVKLPDTTLIATLAPGSAAKWFICSGSTWVAM